MLAFLAVMWDKWWLTGPAVLLMARIMCPTIVQDLILIVATIPLALAQPRQALLILASTCVRLAGDAAQGVSLAFVITALAT